MARPIPIFEQKNEKRDREVDFKILFWQHSYLLRFKENNGTLFNYRNGRLIYWGLFPLHLFFLPLSSSFFFFFHPTTVDSAFNELGYNEISELLNIHFLKSDFF